MRRRRRLSVDATIEAPAAGVVIPPLIEDPSINFTRSDALDYRRVIEEFERRRAESIRLYEPLPKTNIFHESMVRTRLLIGSNRAGKTLSAAVELARAITGQDPYEKYPKENGIAFVFGLDGRHIGNTVFKKVFRAGAFKMIRDPATNIWRAFRPIQDREFAHLAKPAPPLAAPRFVKHIAWEEKKTYTPKVVTMNNGWEIHFFSSLAELPQGQDIDMAWIDEEIKREDLIQELLPRTADRKGRIWWSATPQVASSQLYDLHERAESGHAVTENAAVSEDGDVIEIHCHIKDNPHIDEEEKARLYRSWTDEQRRVRWDGKFLFTSFLVYTEFATSIHAWPQPASWSPPPDWARYFSVDPGRQRCAVVFLAVPPPWVGNFVVAYDELYIKDSDAVLFGKGMGAKSADAVYEVGLIDAHAGRVNEMGSGKNIQVQYQQALVANRIHIRGGPYLTWGSDDVDAGLQAVRDWLRIRGDGQPGFFVHVAKCPHMVWEFQRYRFKPDPVTKLPTDMPVKKNDHLMDDLRYLALHGCVWRKPAVKPKMKPPAVQALERKRKRKTERKGGSEDKIYRLGMGREQKYQP